MNSERHSGRRMLEIVQEVYAAAAVDNAEPDFGSVAATLDLELLKDLSADDLDVSAVLERLTSGARGN